MDANGALRKAVPVGESPTGVAYGAGSVWVADAGDRSIARVDLGASLVRARVDVEAHPTAIALTDNDAWVANFGDGTVSRVNLRTEQQTQSVKVDQPVAIAAGAGRNRSGSQSG